MASPSFALTSTLNFKRSPPCLSSPSFSLPVRRQAPPPAAFIRSEMKMYKGTQMRERRLAEMIEKKVTEAKKACEGEDEISDECKVAWDEVEEISQAKADLRLKIHHLHQDPLEHFCGENPETEECEVYED